MVQSIHLKRFLPFFFPALIALSAILFSFSTLFKTNPEIAVGVTYDLTLLMPLAYLIAIWRKPIPKITVVPFFVLGVILGTVLIPEHLQSHLSDIKNYVLPLVELGIVSFIILNVYKGVKAFKSTANSGETDVLAIIQTSAFKVLKSPKVAAIFTSEIAMTYYSCIFWKREKVEDDNIFTGYKKSGIIALFLTIIFVVIIETAVLHIVLVSWNAVITWIITLSSIYAGIQIFGHTQALRLRHHTIHDDEVHLRYGLFGDITFTITDIESIEINSKSIEEENLIIEKLALFKDFESHNITIHFKSRQIVKKVYGIKKECDILQFYVDNKEGFVARINLLQKATNNEDVSK